MVLSFNDLEKIALTPDISKKWGKDSSTVLQLVQSIVSSNCKTCALRKKTILLNQILVKYGDSLAGIQVQKTKNIGVQTEKSRDTCLECVKKHLAQAYVLQGEFYSGYTEYIKLIEAHIAEAIQECPEDNPELYSMLSDIMRHIVVDRTPNIPLEVILDKFKGIQADKSVINVNLERHSSDFIAKSVSKLSPCTAFRVLEALKKCNLTTVTEFERMGYLAWASEMSARESPELAMELRRRRLSMYSSEIDNKCSDIVQILENLVK